MPGDHRPEDFLQSMYAAAQEIQHKVFLVGLDKRLSADRRIDIIRSAERIVELTKKLGDLK